MGSNDAIPTGPEVEFQLEGMLKNELFKSQEQVANVLKVIVYRALAGLDVTEKYLREELFPSPPYKPDSNIARITVDNLKKALDEYYETDGLEDLVIIGLPQSKLASGRRIKFKPGEAYKPTFRYNPRNPISKKYEEGVFHQQMISVIKPMNAMDAFKAVIKLEPNHAGAHTGLAEVRLLLAFWTIPDRCIDAAHMCATRATELAPNDWHAQAVLGTALLFMRRIAESKRVFEYAMTLGEAQILEYPWYFVFLLVTGESHKALKLAGALANKKPFDPYTRAIYGLLLYVTRQPAEAYRATDDSLKLDEGCWLAYLLRALVVGTASNIKYMERFVHQERYYPGLSALCLSHDAALSREEIEGAIKQTETGLSSREDPDWFQLSLCAIAANNSEGAIDALEKSWETYEPMILFMHILPVLDPLRGSERFKLLEERRLQPISDGKR